MTYLYLYPLCGDIETFCEYGQYVKSGEEGKNVKMQNEGKLLK